MCFVETSKMKCLMYRVADGVAIGMVSQGVLAVMMGGGGMVKADQIDREVAKFLMETKDDEALLRTSVADLLTLRAGPREVAARAFVEGLCVGGLTEAEALRRIAARDQPEVCLECVVIDTTDLPSDLYFRDAWEWSD
jgi:hypothetical protein